MKLKEFMDKFICPNSLVRLLKKLDDGHGYIMLTPEAVMDWEITGLSEKIISCEVVHITDVFCETYREAINIVINTNLSSNDIKEELKLFRERREQERVTYSENN